MDLKALLLRSISSKKVIQRRQRLHLGRLCFIITYQLAGKFLTVKNIRKCSNNKIHQRRFLRSRLVTISRKLSQQRWSTISLKPIMLESEIQTQSPKFKSKETETKTIKTECRTQQTVHKKLRIQGTQTDLVIESLGVQTEQILVCQANQTEWNKSTSALQTEFECCHNEVQTEIKYYSNNYMQTDDNDNPNEHMQVEKEAVVLLLNEIGEMIINQNHLLHNNSTMLGQISEMAMLNKMVSSQDAAMKYYEKFEKFRKIRKFFRRRKRTRYIFYKSEPKETCEVFVQTHLLELLDATTQTNPKIFPKRKFWT